MRAADVLAGIVRLYPPPAWAVFTELHVEAAGGGGQRLDAWAISSWPSTHWERIAFEVKTSRGDYRSEVRNPTKRRAGLLLSNRFYFAVPAGMVAPEEVPIECGLIEIGETGDARIVTVAPWRDTPPVPVRFLASVATRAVNTGERTRAGLAAELKDLRRQVVAERRSLETTRALRRAAAAPHRPETPERPEEVL